MNPRVNSVKALPNHQLELRFENGESGVFSMEQYLKYPVYQPLMNEQLFRQARVSFGTVIWNDDIDMSPDTLYLECKMYAR